MRLSGFMGACSLVCMAMASSASGAGLDAVFSTVQPGTGSRTVNGPVLVDALASSGYDISICQPNCSVVLRLASGETYLAGRVAADGTVVGSPPGFLPAALAGASLTVGRGAVSYSLPAPIGGWPLAETITVAGDLPATIIEKSGSVVPSKGQYDWQRMELTAFLHYGMNTYTNVEWGTGYEAPGRFTPTGFNPDQWMKVLKRNGFKIAILTVKHHEGFMLYPTRYSSYSVKNSPWWTANPGPDGLNPSRDMFRAFVDAARANGMKVGVYLSPADGAEVNAGLPRQGQARFGKGDTPVPVSIPVLVPGDDRVRDPAKTYDTVADAYNTYYMNTLYELLTEYGPIDEMWFDGANPYSNLVQQPYQLKDWYALIRKLQPNTLIGNNAPDIRWIGSESGAFRPNEWGPQAFRGNSAELLKSSNLVGPAHPDHVDHPYTDADLGSARVISGIDLPANLRPTYLSWFPAEADVSIRPGWFWHAAQDTQVKSAATLFQLYESSVGRNAVLLLNTPPTTAGVLSDADVRALDGMGALIRATYGTNLLAGPQAAPGVSVLTDGNPETDWTPGRNLKYGSVELAVPAGASFNRIVLQENILKGQRVEGVTVSIKNANGTWREIATAGSIGFKRILPLAQPVSTTGLRVTITDARAQPYLGSVELYLKP